MSVPLSNSAEEAGRIVVMGLRPAYKETVNELMRKTKILINYPVDCFC
jgi:hypothetical protein